MRIAPQIELDADQRSRVEAIVRSRKLPAATGCGNKPGESQTRSARS